MRALLKTVCLHDLDSTSQSITVQYGAGQRDATTLFKGMQEGAANLSRTSRLCRLSQRCMLGHQRHAQRERELRDNRACAVQWQIECLPGTQESTWRRGELSRAYAAGMPAYCS